jgi:hypothetical protein
VLQQKPKSFPSLEYIQSPFQISTTELESVQVAANLVEELFKRGQSRVVQLDGMKKSPQLMLMGLRFNLEDRITVAKEAEEESTDCASTVEDLKFQLQHLCKHVNWESYYYVLSFSFT